jgi:hypothetical protein
VQKFARHLILWLAVLAFAGAMPSALAVPSVLAGEPCPHDHDQVASGYTHRHHSPQQHRHGSNAVTCVCCCIGAFLAIPDIPRSAGLRAVFAASGIIYPESSAALAGRSPRPEPAPPRGIALI